MSATNSFETALLQHIFQNANIANIGDSTGLRGSTTAGSLFVRLCTSATAPSETTAGTEASYTGYVAGGVGVVRSGSGWVVSGNNASNAAAITFGTCTGGTNTIRYFEIWTSNSGGDRLFYGQLNTDLAVSAGITPEFAIGDLDVNVD